MRSEAVRSSQSRNNDSDPKCPVVSPSDLDALSLFYGTIVISVRGGKSVILENYMEVASEKGEMFGDS